MEYIYHYNLKYRTTRNTESNVDGIYKTDVEIVTMDKYREVKKFIVSIYDDVKDGVMITSLSRLK